ncbi:peroxisomal membrane anchor protein conserved region-domain-containing protein [Chytriomyces sp. MP71]|nr:peroxisomal membrane anchor protein conserved region-domain-containing protein [Chytriomyces sp. MP71]
MSSETTAVVAPASPPTPTSANSGAAVRRESVALAVKFLVDPKVRSAPLAKRIAFLESKGLSQAEIDAAMSEAEAGSGSDGGGPGSAVATAPPLPPLPPSSYRGYYPPAGQQQLYQRDWRDYTLGTIGALGFGYGIFHLFQNYILPNISWPISAKERETQERLDKQMADITAALGAATTTIQQQSEQMKQAMNQSLLEQEKNADEVHTIREELEALKGLLPSLTKSNPGDPSLTDLQSELRSLKNLLLNRKSFPPIPTQTSTIPLAYQSSSQSSPPKVNGVLEQPDEDVDAFLGKFTTSKPGGVPAWQLAAKKETPVIANTSDVASSSASANGSPEGYSVNVGGGAESKKSQVETNSAKSDSEGYQSGSNGSNAEEDL